MKYLKIETDARAPIIIATMFVVSRRVIVCRSKNTSGIRGSVVNYIFEEYRDRNGVYEAANSTNAPVTNVLL